MRVKHFIKIKRISLILLVGVVSGCALYGPSYKQPNVGADKSWPSKDSLAKIESGVNLSNTPWWTKFNDAQLNGLIESALANNNSIQMDIGTILQSQGSLDQVKAAWIPTVGGQIGYNGTNGSSSSSGLSVTSTGYNATLTPSYTINVLQQIRNQEASNAGLMSSIYAKDFMRLSVITQVAQAYFNLIGYDYQLDLQKQLVADYAKQLELNKDQYQRGYLSLLNLQTSEQNYYNAKAQIPVIENNIVASKNSLRLLTDQNPGEIKRNDDFLSVKMDGIIPAGLPSDVLKTRPDIMQAEAQLKQANANIGVATSAFFPSINLTNPIGEASSDLNSLFTSSSNFWQTNAAINANLFNVALWEAIKTAKGTYYNVYYNYMNVVRTAFQSVDNSLSAHQKLTDSYNFQNEQFKSTELGYKIGNQRYVQGADSYSQMLTYKITMDSAAITLYNIKLQQLQAIVTLYENLGAGYNFKNTDEPKKFGDSHDS